MDALEAAHVVKAIMLEQLSSLCVDVTAAREWYTHNIDVWDDAKIATHAPDGVKRARAGIALEGAPSGERGLDCWGVEISTDRDVLASIPGWYMECWACWLVLFYRSPTSEEI